MEIDLMDTEGLNTKEFVIDVNEAPSEFMAYVEDSVEACRDSILAKGEDQTIAYCVMENTKNTVYSISVFNDDDIDFNTLSGNFLHSEVIQEYWCEERNRFCLKISVSNDTGNYDVINGVEKITYNYETGEYVFDTGFSKVKSTDIFDSKILFN